MTSRPVLFAVLLVLLLATGIAALLVGPLDIPPLRVLGAFFPIGETPQVHELTTIRELRLPRIVLAILIGAALATAGAAMQGIFRNPLADPGLVGVSSGAALAAVCVIVLGAANAFPGMLPLATFAGGALAALLVARLARIDGHTRVATMLLAGLALNAIAGAGIGFLSHVADDLALRTLTFWMFGSLGKAGWNEIAFAAPLLVVALVLLPRDARALDALLLGEAEAGHLGIEVERLKRRVSFLIVLAVGTSVALGGIIGFVGLVVPHLVRLAAGPDHRVLLPASALLGALLLLLADIGARTALDPTELPIGILTALIGGPFFIALLLRYRGRAELL